MSTCGGFAIWFWMGMICGGFAGGGDGGFFFFFFSTVDVDVDVEVGASFCCDFFVFFFPFFVSGGCGMVG